MKQSFKMALKSMAASKMRSFLTMLGIIIGVASVIVLVSLVNGFANNLTSTFDEMGTNLITVSIFGRNSTRSISDTDMYEVYTENTDLYTYMSPTVSVKSSTVKYENSSLTTSTITGVSEDYAGLKSMEISQGRFLQYMDIYKRQKVCVIGSYVQNELFSMGSAIGQKIKINGQEFEIVGVFDEIADSTESSSDDIVVVPYTTTRVIGGAANPTTYTFSAKDTDNIDACKEKIEDVLYEKFGSSDAYRISNVQDALEKINELTGTLTLVLVGIAGISLLVGGIGIMNIMLVSVTERTKEIGIRKSLGAKRRDIMSQFVIEAATTSSVGGIIGIILGCISAVGIGNMMSLNATPSLGAIGIAFSVSVVIGITFGYFPAAKASKLNPIDALRFD